MVNLLGVYQKQKKATQEEIQFQNWIQDLSFYYLLPAVEKCWDKSVKRKATPSANTMQSFMRIGGVFFTLSQTDF